MEVLRVKLTQSSANYRKEDTNINKMTYPLPPLSTIIGAIHKACNYTTYKDMDISIQGKYGALNIEPYTDYCFLNSVQDDRGILVKLRNANSFSTAFDKVAKAIKAQGNSFRNGITIQVYNDNLIQEYRDLKNLNDKIKEFKVNRIDKIKNLIKLRKKNLTAKIKTASKEKSIIYKNRLSEIKVLDNEIDNRFNIYKEENYNKPYSKFASLTTSLRYYEVLNDIELIIHIKSDKNTLLEIEKNIYNIKSIGRSEDFIDIKEVKLVKVYEEVEHYENIVSENSAYIDFDLVKDDIIIPKISETKKYSGTKYYINKKYTIVDKKRIFEKKKVLYISGYSVDDITDNVFFDKDGDKTYIVNFI